MTEIGFVRQVAGKWNGTQGAAASDRDRKLEFLTPGGRETKWHIERC